MVQQEPDPAVIAEINEVTTERLILAAREDEIVQRTKRAVQALELSASVELTKLHKQIAPVDARLWELLQQHRSTLIAPSKQSFITMIAKFQFKKKYGKEKITDPDAIMDVARTLGVVMQIADPPGGWRFNATKFWAWLGQRGDMREHFAGLLEKEADSEGLTISPNSNYTVMHDHERVSPPSVSIKSPSSAAPES